MKGLLQHLPGPRRRWRSALLLLCLLATGSVQLAAATHWHQSAQPEISAGSPAPGAPGGVDHDGCLLCQVAAHAASAAPPPAPWALVSSLETSVESSGAAQGGVLVYAPSHSWQGRAPPKA